MNVSVYFNNNRKEMYQFFDSFKAILYNLQQYGPGEIGADM